MNLIKQNKEGFKVLVAGAVLQLFSGVIYVWSVLKNPVSAYYGWSPEDVTLTASFMLCFFSFGILAGGKLLMMMGPTKTTFLGGMLLTFGMLSTALIPAGGQSSVFLVYILYGVMGGLGAGISYGAIVSNVQKWFPNNRGFATGVSVGAFGFAAVMFAPVIVALNNYFQMEVKNTFLVLSAAFALVTLVAFRFVKSPQNVTNTSNTVFTGKQYTTSEMVKTLRFYLLASSMMFGMSVFMVINPELTDLANNRNAAAFATGLVMVMGISSTVGRFVVPLASDKLGRENTDIVILSITSLCAFCLCFVTGIWLIITVAMVTFCFGGITGLYPVLSSDNFGLKNVGTNYGVIMLGFAASAFIFPLILRYIDVETAKFIALGIFASMGVVAISWLKILNSKKQS
jgi:OFA family oxalate/formate antiporter-like MFS transporter